MIREKFWEWMKKNGHGWKSQFDEKYVCEADPFDRNLKPTEQMLVGYKFEYLFERGVAIGDMDICCMNCVNKALDKFLDFCEMEA